MDTSPAGAECLVLLRPVSELGERRRRHRWKTQQKEQSRRRGWTVCADANSGPECVCQKTFQHWRKSHPSVCFIYKPMTEGSFVGERKKRVRKRMVKQSQHRNYQQNGQDSQWIQAPVIPQTATNLLRRTS